MKSTSTTQAVVSLSSAEAEFYAAVKAAAAGIGCVFQRVMLSQQGVEVKAKGLGDDVDSPSLEIKLNATAGRAIAMRRGAGHIRHIAAPTLWLQRLVISGDIKMTRVGGSGNETFGLSDHDQTLKVLWNAFCRKSESDGTPIGALDGN